MILLFPPSAEVLFHIWQFPSLIVSVWRLRWFVSGFSTTRSLFSLCGSKVFGGGGGVKKFCFSSNFHPLIAACIAGSCLYQLVPRCLLTMIFFFPSFPLPGSFLWGRAVSSLHFIYLYQYGLIDINFIVWIKTPNYRFYFVAEIFPALAVGSYCSSVLVSFQHIPVISEACPCFLALQHGSGSSCIFPALLI